MSATIFPRDKYDKTGWVISYAYLQQIKDELSIYEDCPGLMEIENVLLSKTVSSKIQQLEDELEELKSTRDKWVERAHIESERLAIAVEALERCTLPNCISDHYELTAMAALNKIKQ